MKMVPKGPMISLDEATVTKEWGVENDSRGRPGRRQVSVLARESWEEACDLLDTTLSWTTRRANLYVEGIPSLFETVGSFLYIGEVILEIQGETKPCARMDAAAPGLRESLKPNWLGGVTCSVVKGGKIVVGDPVIMKTVCAEEEEDEVKTYSNILGETSL
ncbi:MAG: MOSC domain-containing protein [Candidatus Brocadiaceae bacterium]|nr:MOSC domain-containing protein [Candidatus Brocadiaceae bacterium]